MDRRNCNSNDYGDLVFVRERLEQARLEGEGRPERDTVISHDEVVDLRISLGTMSADEFIASL